MEDHRISKDDISNNNNNVNPRQLQLFVKLVNGQTLSLQFSSPQVQVGSVKRQIQEITKIPINFQRLIRGHQLKDDSVISHPDATLNLSFSLLGGKGGFGSLLRGAATKAGQKKTINFEACRVGDGEAEKYVAKYREQSARCVAVVEESVKAACLGKRKAVPGGADPKRLKIW
ncbi:hypothetical protein GOBAR_AA30476 [Gossypium barbadense]|uniref:Ubiquitin-like domain-containing protein n=1 Tax=Gossypium barbadense TaxID=3634 RepID=A0A2P5WGI8_GOSBA|nr:hypothetical protein GOBAR_AA30476 [Gossypium barbadense]